MLPREILKEYNTEKTAQNFGKKLFLRYFQDLEQTPGAQTITGIPMETWLQQTELEEKINDPKTAPEDKVKLEQTLEKLKTKTVYKLLKTFEDIDPTNNKEYVQWLVRTYINDQTSIEDIGSTVAEYLAKFNALKIKRHIKPPKNDVGQYKTFSSFLDEVDQYQDPLEDEKDKKAERGKYEVMYDADNLLVLKPKDKTAACFFGRGTRWCTAATRGSNYFTHYNRQGPMYIIIPRKPEHPGEKYQFHFDSSQFAEESDRMLNNGEKLQLVTKYPQLADIFKQQAEERGLFWLQKPIVKKDEKYTLYIYKKDNQPYLRVVPKEPAHEGEEYFIEKNRYRENDVTVSNEKNGILSPVEEYNFAERMPELIEKLGINFDGYDPKTSEKIQGENKTSVKFGENYVIVNTSDGQYLISGGDDEPRASRKISRGVHKWNPESTSHYNSYIGYNPYEFMIEHPEINTMLQDKLNQIQNATRDGMQRHGDNESYKYGWMAPHSSLDINNGTIYEFGQNGKAVVYYIKENYDTDSGIALSMSPNGEVDKMVSIDALGNTNTLTFLQQVAFINKHPELKQLLPNVDSFNPKSIDLGDAVLEEYNTEKSRDGREIILKENYFLTPKEPSVPGEKYSLSVTYAYDIDPATNELYNKRYIDIESYAFRDDLVSPKPLTTVSRYNRNEGKDLALLISLTQKYPKLKDYIDYSQSIARSSGYRGYRRSLGQTIDNDRVKIERYDEIDSAGDATSHGTPTLLVNDKKTGDSYVVRTFVRDQRGKTGKIGRIDVVKVSNNIVNWDMDPDSRDTALASETLREPDVLALFRKFPEMVDIIKAENIHPKSPHPALVKVPVDDEELRVTTDNFRVERKPDDKTVEYIIFKDKDKPNLLVSYPERHSGYGGYYGSDEVLPSRIEIINQGDGSGRSGGERIRYGTHMWYDLMSENPDLKEYFINKASQEKVAVAGAGKPAEIKNITTNVREYVFNGEDGKLLFFTPITNPIKDSASDTKENKWFSNGVAVPIAPGNTNDALSRATLINDPVIKKEIANYADEAHGESRVPHYSSYLGEPEKIETENSTPYTIEKYGTKNPVYKLRWKLPAGTRSYGIFPSDKNDYERKINRGEEWPNDDLAKLSLKILPQAGNYNAQRVFTNSRGLYIKPNTGDIGIIGDDGSTTASLSNITYIELLNALYKNIPEIKKLLPPKKAKEFGITPQETRKLNLDPNITWDENQYYISSNKKPHGANYQPSWRNTTDLLPGTAYTIYYKNNNGDTRIMNTLYFPEKGPVVIFDGRGDKETYTTDQKISRFVDRFPDLKSILEPFAKSNKWLKESAFEIINHLLTESELVYDYFDETTVEEIDPYISLLENELAESLGDLAWAKKKSTEIKQAKKEWKPNYHFVKPGELRGSYTDQQMLDMGFKMASSGNWYMPQKKFQDLIKSGKLREDEQAILEGKKLPRTSEFLHVKQDLQRLAGISEHKGDSMGSNISYTASKISKIMKDKNIQPGTDEWFQLWFSKPYLTGEKPYGD